MPILVVCCSANALGQSGQCNSGVPFFAVNLTGQPEGFYISPSIARSNHCCGVGNPDRCIEFQITLDPAAVGINFEIYSGAQPPGALYYQINCGPMVPVGQQICLSGAGPHTLTFCKPGNNKNQYRITSIKGYSRGVDVTTVEDCYADLQVTGLVDSTIVWSSITGNGYFNSFLDCTSGCSRVRFLTQVGFPSYVDFEVCGKIYSGVCQGIMQTICDTIRVNIEPKVEATVTPDTAVFCEIDSGRLMTVEILPRKSSYVINWMSGPDATGNVLSNDSFYFAQSAGTYSVVVIDTSFLLCSADTANFTLTAIPPPPVIIYPRDTTICNNHSAVLTASGAVNYSWSPVSSLSCGNCASVSASPIISTTYYVTGTDSFGCESVDSASVNVIMPEYTSLGFSICQGDFVTVGNTVYNAAGLYQDTLVSSSGCDSIITSTVQIRSKFSTFIDTVICSGTSLSIGGSVYSTSGIYFDTVPASNGCDSMIETHLAVHPVGVCDNPDLNPCPQRIVFVLDESGSISGSGGGSVANISTQVRSAASGLISSLNGTGSQVAVVEFNSTARRANIGGLTGYQSVSAAYISNFNTYIAQDGNTTGSASNYDPEDYSCTVPQNCYTNWEDAFEEVQSINSSLGLANLVIFFTDGQPTAFNNSFGSVTVGTGAAAIAQALSEAKAAANIVQGQGSHIFVIGLPNPTLPETNVQQISGIERFPDMQQSFLKADYTISSSAQLVNSVIGIARMMCQADLQLDMTANSSAPCAGSNAIFSIIVTNDGSGNATGVQVKDYLSSGYTYMSDDGGAATSFLGSAITWYVGNLYNGESDTLRVTVTINASGNFKNVAEVTASDQTDGDSTPNNDNGDQSEDDETAGTISILNCDDGNPCTNDGCTGGNCTHSYIPSACSISGDIDICSGEATQFTASGGISYSWSGPNGFAGNSANTGVVSQAGTYSVTVTNADGCTGTCSVILTVHSLPSCNINGDNRICSGGNTSFTASGGSSYSWSGPNEFSATTANTALISFPGNYSVTVTNSGGCSSNCARTLTLLSGSLTSINDAVCSGETYVLAAKTYSSAGTYHDTLTGANGCDSIIVLNLQVLPLSYGPFDFTFCQGDSVIVGSSVYKNTGVYYDTFISHFGCDSIVISNVQVSNHSQNFINTSFCQGDSIIVGNSTYRNTGIYLDTLIGLGGCDSIVHTNLLAFPIHHTLLDTVICSGESVFVGTSTYSVNGTYIDTLTSLNGCDSIVQTNLQVLSTYVTVVDTTICFGELISIGSNNYSVSGNYSDTIISFIGCDSVVKLNLQVLPLTYGPFDFTLCQGDSVVVGSSVYKNAGLYNDTFTSSDGCDSIVISNIRVFNHSQTLISSTICSGENVIVGSSVYNTNGVYIDTLMTSNGCDSIVQLNLFVFQAFNSLTDTVICAGESIVVGTAVYQTSGTYLDTLVSSNGCDSIVQTNLQVDPIFITAIDTIICFGEMFTIGGIIYNTSGIYSDTLTSYNGCDSIINLNLQVLPLIYGPFDFNLCKGDSIIVGNSVYRNSGIFNDTFTSANGCDSIVIIAIQVLNNSQVVNNYTICTGESITIGSSTYSSSGIYSDTLIGANGCDSLIQTNLLVLPVNSTTIDTSTCAGESITIGGSTYSTSGTYFDTLASTNGCDSIIQTNLQVYSIHVAVLDTTICYGEAILIGSFNYNVSGTYSDTFIKANGCDSIVTLNLRVLPRSYGPFDYIICMGDSVVVGNSVYKNSGTFNDTITSASGCDSIVISTVKVLNRYNFLVNATICFGESFSTYNTSGIYFDSLISSNGCDSIVQINLLVIAPDFTLVDTAICSGENLLVGSSNYTTSGNYLDTLTSESGCDSIIQTSLNFLPVHLSVIDTAICFGEFLSVGTSNYSSSGIYHDTLVAFNGCDSIVTAKIQVYPKNYGPFSIALCESDSVQIGNSVYRTPGNYFDTLISALGCDSIVQTAITVNDTKNTIIDTSLCEGSVFRVGNSSYNSTGRYFDTLAASNGCDSIIETNIHFLKVPLKAVSAEICQGQIFFVGNKAYTTSGVYRDILRAANGCDSIVTTTLKVYPAKFSTLVISICMGDSVVIGNSVYRKTGTYLNTFRSSHGCDSIVQTKLQVWPEVGGAADRIVCFGENLQFNLTGGIQYLWTPSTGLSCSNCSNPVASPNDDINYIVRVTDNHHCKGFDTIHVDVSRVEVSINISDNEVCEGEVVSCSETYQSDFPLQSRIWDFRDGFVTTDQNPVYAYLEEGVYSVGLTKTNSQGCSGNADTIITVYPNPEITLSRDTAICLGDSVQLNAFGANLYAWVPTDYLSNSMISDPVAKPQSSIRYTVVGYSVNGCLNQASMNIIVNPLPELRVSDDVAVCPNGSVVLFALGGTEYTWYPPNGLSSTSSQFVAATPRNNTTYHITALNQFGCEAADSVRVGVYPKAEFKVSPNGEICKGEKIELSARGGMLYRWTPPSGLSCPECESTIASPSLTTKYSVATTDAFGCKYKDSVAVFVREIPDVSTIPDVTICKGETVVINTDTSFVNHFKWNPRIYLNNPQSISPTASPETSITYVVSVTNEIGCTDEDSVRIKVIEKVDADLVGANACPGDEVKLEAVVNSASENGFEILWSPAGLFDDLHAPNQTVRLTNDTEVSVIVSSATCVADTGKYFIQLHDLPEVDAGSGKVVYMGEEVSLTASSYSVINSYIWSPAKELECSECQSANWIADRSRTFAVRVVDENGCSAVDSVAFKVVGNCNDDIYVPNAFTPNGDEVNDKLLVRSQNQIELEYFKIFDRWGKEVYSSSDIEEGWDGLHTDKKVVPGVYVYHLKAGCRNGQSVFLKGNVTVIR